ncbi:unnamed protein product [Xylocopa violacea]|uniref:Uncharacterized protein n=1 Tax=Xylocopa violacea TaxID=135666 RepID=A0ABP1MYJ3_XYLVO
MEILVLHVHVHIRKQKVTHERKKRDAEELSLLRGKMKVEEQGRRTERSGRRKLQRVRGTKKKTGRKVHASVRSKRESIEASFVQVAYIHLLLLSFLLSSSLSPSLYPFLCSRTIKHLSYLPILLPQCVPMYIYLLLPADTLLKNSLLVETYLAARDVGTKLFNIQSINFS